MAKYLQNDVPMATLLGTDDAATRDGHWGGSCSLWSEDLKKLTYKGQNKLGKLLMDLRNQFKGK